MFEEIENSFQDDPSVPEITIIQSQPTENMLLMIGSLGSLLYVIFFFVRAEWATGFLFLGLSTFLAIKYFQYLRPKPALILSNKGIQVIGQPFVSWAAVHGLTIRSEVKKDEYVEKLIFVNNGRIQEIPLKSLATNSWKLDKLVNLYQERCRYGLSILENSHVIPPQNSSEPDDGLAYAEIV